MTQIFAFGHSITHGFWDPEGGWVQRLRKILDKKSLENSDEYYFEVYNLGVSGDDSTDLVNRIESELNARLWEEDETVILIQIGANDIQYFNEEYRLRTPKEQFKENLMNLISISRNYTDRIMFVGDPVTTIEGPIPWAKDKELSDSRLKNYTDTVRRTCENENIPFVDIRSELSKSDWSEKLEDGCHPNREGHKLIFERVKEKLKEEELIDF